MAELSSLVFATDTTELERASRAIASLVQDMSQISVASANMARISAQTEAILARAATESAKARKENARAADIEIKTIIAADKADAEREKQVRKTTEAVEKATTATKENVSILQRQSDIYEFLAAGFSKGQSSILATAKASGQLSDELKKVLEAQKQFTSDSFDQSETGLKRLLKTTKEVTDAQRFFNEGANLTTKQARELSNDLDRLNASLKSQGKSYQDISKAQSIHKKEFLEEAAAVNRANAALDVMVKQRKEVSAATDYMTQAEQKLSASLSTANSAIDRSGTDLLVKYEAALRKSGIAQDVATQKLAAYKAQLVQVQGQEELRRGQHLARALQPQATDIAVSLWSGQNPLTVMLQQFGQINDLFQLSGVKAEEFAKTVRGALASMVPSIATVLKGVAEVVVGLFADAGKAVVNFINLVPGVTDAMDTAKKAAEMAGISNAKFASTLNLIGNIAGTVFAVGIAAALAGVVALGIGAMQAIKENDKMAVQLGMTGAAMGLTFDRATELSKGMQDINISTSDALKVLASMAKQGGFTAEEIRTVTKAAVELETYGGVSIEETVKSFAKMKEKPVESMLELAKSTGLVSVETVKAVMEMESQGNVAGSTAKAIEELARVTDEQVDRMKKSYNGFSLFMIDLGKDISKFFSDAFKDLFYASSPKEQLKAQLKAVNETLDNWGTMNMDAAGLVQSLIPGEKERVQLQRQQLLNKIGLLNMEDQAYEASQKYNQSQIAMLSIEKGVTDELDKQNLTRSKKKDNLSDFTAKFVEEKAKDAAQSKRIDIELIKNNDSLMDSYKKLAKVEWESAQKKGSGKDTFYDTSMSKFRDASIAASDATKELTKSQIELMQVTTDPKFAGLSEQKKLDILQSGAAAIAKEEEKEATIALGKAEEFREKVLGKSEGLGKQYYADIEALKEHAKAAGWSTEQVDEMIRAIYKGTPVYQNYQKTLDRMTESLRKFSEESITYQASTNAENQELDHRISLLGKTAEEQRKLQIEYQREMKINTARVELEKKLRDIAKDKAKAEKDGIVDTKKLKEFADAEVQAQQDAAERIKVINKGVAVEYASDLDKEIAAIRGGISDSIVTALFEGGKEGSKKLRSVLEDALRKKVTIVVDAVVNTLVGNVIGSITGAAGGQGGVASGIQTASNLNSIWGTASQAMYGASAGASMASLGYANTVGVFGGDALGALASANGMWAGVATGAQASAQAAIATNLALEAGTGVALEAGTLSAASAEVAGSAAAATESMGSMLAAAGPWVAGALAIMAIADMTTTRGANHGGGLYSSMGQTNQEAASQLTGKLGWKDPEEDFTKRGNTELNKQVESTVKGLLELYNGLGKLASGTVKELEVVAGFATNSKYDDEESYGYFQILEKATGELLKEYTNRDMEKDGGKAWEQYVADLGTAMVTELRSSDIPSWMDGILKELGDAPTLESFQKAVTEIHKIDQAFSTFGKTIDGFDVMTDKTFEALMKGAGGIDKLTPMLASYYDSYYTESERFGKATKALSDELAKAGITMPATRDGYRALVEAQDLTTEAGRKNFVVLMQNESAFAKLTPAAAAASKQIATFNKIASNVGLKTDLKDVNFTDATKTLFESFGVAVEDYSNSISGVLDGILTGKVKAEDAGKALAESAVGGITGAIAKAGTDAIAAQFVMSVITPILNNIKAGKAALDGVDVQGAVAKANQDAVDLKIVLNTLGIDIGNGLKGFADGIVTAGNTATQMIARTSKFTTGGDAGSTTTIYSPSNGSGSGSGQGLNQYGGLGDSRFAIGGSAVNNPYQSPIAQSLSELTNQTLSSNLKVSELLQKLLNPEKLFENKYKALDDQLIQQRKELSRTNVGGGLGVNESTLQADIDALKLKIADTNSVNAVIDPLMSVLNRMATSYAATTDAEVANTVFDDLTKLILSRDTGAVNKESGLLLGSVMSGNSTWSIEDRVKATLKDLFSSASSEGKLDWFDGYINQILGITSDTGKLGADLKAKTDQLDTLEKELREWYIAQARLIAVEDMSALATETTAAKAKTAELKRTGGLEDPVSKLKEQLAQKMQAIDEGIGKALLAEVDVLKRQKAPDSVTKPIQAEIDKSKKLLADFISAPETLLNSLQSEYAELSGNPARNTNSYIINRMKELQKEIQAIQSGTFTADLGAEIAGLEDKMIAALLAATDPAKQQALLDEIAKYKGGITEWYKAQADLLSTEMLVDINKQIKELETGEKGPLTTIKDAIQKYIDDFKALGTLTDDIQTQIDKLSGLQLTKARKSLYDQLLSPEELKTRDTLALTSEFSKLGKVIPDSTSSLRAMIDAANAAGNITLADNLLELVPAFLALQDAADGANGALSKAKTATDEAYAALERAVEAQRTILTESITKLKAVFDAAKNAAKTLYSEVDSVRKQSAEAGNAFIDQALQDLKNSGVIPDGVKLQDAIDSSMKGLSSEVYDSAFEEQRGRLILAGKLTTIADLTEPQLTLAEKQLKDLDAILETARAQIDELRGINTSVLSVATAISNLAAAIAAEKATVVQPVVPTTGGVNPYPWKDTGSGGGAAGGSTGGSTGGSVIDQAYQLVLGRNADATGAAYWGSVLGSGATLTEAINAIVVGAQSSGEAIKLPGFDVGINNVPYDMPAYLHAGESVIPSEFNPFNPNAVSPLSLVPASNNAPVQQDNSEIIEENRLLRQELQAQNGAMVRLLSKVARVVERWDGDGLPEPRTETA